MTATATLFSIISMHRRLVKAPNIHIRAKNGVMRLISSSENLVVMDSSLPSNSEFSNVCIDAEVFKSFLKATTDIDIISDGQSLKIKGSRIKGEIPCVAESYPTIPDANSREIDTQDVKWLARILPLISVSSMKNSGILSAECVDGRWSVSCTDEVHGACAFGEGNSNIKFSLLPKDSSILLEILALAEGKSPKEEQVTFGKKDGLLIIKSGSNRCVLPTIDGSPQSKETVLKNNNLVAKVSARGLLTSCDAISAFASAKEAPPVGISLTEDALSISVSSSAGSINKSIAAQSKRSVKFGVSYDHLSNLISLLNEEETVRIRLLEENNEVTMITFESQGVYYAMLTAA